MGLGGLSTLNGTDSHLLISSSHLFSSLWAWLSLWPWPKANPSGPKICSGLLPSLELEWSWPCLKWDLTSMNVDIYLFSSCHGNLTKTQLMLWAALPNPCGHQIRWEIISFRGGFSNSSLCYDIPHFYVDLLKQVNWMPFLWKLESFLQFRILLG